MRNFMLMLLLAALGLSCGPEPTTRTNADCDYQDYDNAVLAFCSDPKQGEVVWLIVNYGEGEVFELVETLHIHDSPDIDYYLKIKNGREVLLYHHGEAWFL